MIPLGIILLETVRVAAHILEVLFGFPAEKSLCFRGIGIVFGDVTGTARSNDIRNGDIIHAGIGIDQFQHGIAVAGTKIDDLGAFKLARDIKERIENEMTYPGQIKVSVIREYRAVETAK